MLELSLTASFKTDSPKTRAYRLVSVPSSCRLSNQLIKSHLGDYMQTLKIITGYMKQVFKRLICIYSMILFGINLIVPDHQN